MTTILGISLLSGCILVVPPTDTCDDVVRDFERELRSVQSCDVDADCGQVLTGTSCGCTRALVAHLDADTTKLYDLIDEASSKQCDVGLASVCDCPAAAGFLCDDGTCAWNYIDSYPYLPECAAADGDALTVNTATVEGNDLVIDVTYSGGCAEHDITLCWPDQSFMESKPVQASLELFHDDHDDACDGLVSEDRRFSLRPLADAHRDAYGSTSGTIEVHVMDQTVTYTFEE